MINNYYKLYIDATFKLAETVCIKFEDVANSYNLWLIEKHPTIVIDNNDKATWKYYQNISGLYHVKDTPMTVVSLDDLSEIVFSKTTLKNHKATLAAYQYDTRYYRDLVNRYPDQEVLIQGILYAPEDPAFITTAISADNGTLLYYPPQYVEAHEYSLISKLQSWVSDYCNRWIVFPFTNTDDLYPATYMGQLFVHMVPALINLRLAACKTGEAHTFHIRQYLASHGMLDTYLDALTKEQALFFYRNILYIQSHAGRRETFDWLVENIMTKRSLPLFEYTLKHDVSYQLPNEYNPLQLDYQPKPFFKRKALNVSESNKLRTGYTLDQMLTKLEPSAVGNVQYHLHQASAIDTQLKMSVSNVVYTKVLESILDDYTDEVPYTLESILLNHWIHWSATGLYTAKIALNILGGKRTLQLSAKEVLILYIYCVNQAMGITTLTVPKMIATRVQKLERPSLAQLRSVTENKYVTTAQLQTLLSTYRPISPLVSVNGFYQAAYGVYESTIAQYGFQSSAENDNTCAQLQMATSHLFCDHQLTLLDDTTSYNDWLLSKDMDFSTYSANDHWLLAESLLDQITGYTANKSLSIKKIQRSMLEILGTLSSYSVQLISDVNNSSIRLASFKEIKVNNAYNLSSNQEYVETAIFDTHSARGKDHSQTNIPLSQTNEDRQHTVSHSASTVDLTVSELGLYNNPQRNHCAVEVCGFGALTGFDPYAQYLALTLTQKQTLSSVYH